MGFVLLFLLILSYAFGGVLIEALLLGMLVVRPVLWRRPRLWRWLAALVVGGALRIGCGFLGGISRPVLAGLVLLNALQALW